MSERPNLQLSTDIQYLKGVGPKLAALFRARGIGNIRDLVFTFPRAYEDRRAARSIATLQENETVSLVAQVVSVRSHNLGFNKRKVYNLLVGDGSGRINCKFFRVPFRGYFDSFHPHQRVRVVGKITNFRGVLEFHHPEIRALGDDEDPFSTDEILPIYSESEGLSSNQLRRLILKACEGLQAQAMAEKTPVTAAAAKKKNQDWIEPFPLSWLVDMGFPERLQALQVIHNPPSQLSKPLAEFRTPAQTRMIFEEFFELELMRASQKLQLRKLQGPHIEAANVKSWTAELHRSLPFQLTKAQKKVLGEISKDFSTGSPMNRLVQGDVGSGKTIVALLTVAQVVQSGWQAALMAPTEILAEQHFKNSQKIFAHSPMKIAFLSGSTKTKDRQWILQELAAGRIDLLIGTHALIEDPVVFKNLGLVVIDEQHRFGVRQRGLLKAKGQNPHFLLMTATPIPRTLAMTLYGDLEVSILDELPPGRQPIQTRVVAQKNRLQMWEWIGGHLRSGRQAYVVYPLVEESEKMDLKNAVDECAKLQKQFPEFRFGLLHGKMAPDEKDAIMESFRRLELQVLVSTTVIEVGVDVPNATIMLIEHAERFGLSQLHQLRGRVGRGTEKSVCFLAPGYAVSEEGYERLRLLESTQDGFRIAQADLELRGPGEFLGTRQSGILDFKMGNLVRDQKILELAKQQAEKFLQADPELLRHPGLKQILDSALSKNLA